MTALEIQNYINDLLEQGTIKRTGLYLIDEFDKLSLDDETKFLAESIKDTYLFYLASLNKLFDYKDAFLKTLKDEETKRNQVLEQVSGFLIQVYMNSRHVSATNIALKSKTTEDADIKLLLRMHKTLLNGLSKSTEVESKLRKENTTFVGNGFTDNGRIINVGSVDYLPIDYNEIPEALTRILEYYNQKEFNSENDLFINPIIIHGLIASLQCFNDGNTRLARILEHVQLWDLTNKLTKVKDLNNPAIYISEAIMRTNNRDNYRNIIKEMAINPNQELLNEWIKFNLTLIEKAIFYNQDKVRECSQVLQRIKK